MRANEDDKVETKAGDAHGQTGTPEREPYTSPVIEKFPPMGNVTFGTNVQPMLAQTLVGA